MAFPGTRPRKALLQPITIPQSIQQQFQVDWTTHSHWCLCYLHTVFRYVLGLPATGDYIAINDLYRSTRFDIASHYNRALDPSEPHNLTSVDQILNPVGRKLATLLDQMINLHTAVGIQLLVRDGLFSRGQLRQRLPYNILRSLGVINSEEEYHTFDAVASSFQLGEEVVRLLADVYQTKGLLEEVSEGNYQAFNMLVASDPYFSKIRVETGRFLSTHGVESQGLAQDLVSAYLVAVNALITREVRYIQTCKPSPFLFMKKYQTPSFECSFTTHEMDGQVSKYLGYWGSLMAFSLRGGGTQGFQGLTETELRYFSQGR